MTYESIDKGYALWNDKLMLPMKRNPGEKQKYFVKEVSLEDVDKYWEYICEDGQWNVYYVIRGKNRRLACANVGKFSPESIMMRIKDRDISVNDCRKIEEHEKTYCPQEKIIQGVVWSRDFDGKSVFELMEQWPKMPFAHVKMVIENEGGSIDNKGIIHKGK